MIAELEKAYNEIKLDNSRAWIWNPVLSRYTPGFVQQCHWAIQRSKDLVEGFLLDNMLAVHPDGQKIAKNIITKLTDHSSDKGHDYHIHFQECSEMGLNVTLLENMEKTMQDLVLTVHHCFMYTLSNTPCFKMIENHIAGRTMKIQIATQQMFIQQMPLLPPI